MIKHQAEEEEASTSLKEYKQDLVQNSNHEKSLQRKLLLVAKELKSKNIDEHIPKEEKKIKEISQQIAALESKPNKKGQEKEIKKKEEKLEKHRQKLEELQNIKQFGEDEDSKKLVEPIEAAIKNCKLERAELKKNQKKKITSLNWIRLKERKKTQKLKY